LSRVAPENVTLALNLTVDLFDRRSLLEHLGELGPKLETLTFMKRSDQVCWSLKLETVSVDIISHSSSLDEVG
jgi:hypothetical protein